MTSQLDVSKIRKDFPILARRVHDHPLVYLDNGATSQKPSCVVDALNDYYLNANANVHRGVHWLSQEATDRYEGVRKKVAQFIGADGPDLNGEYKNIIFTRGTTEAINLVAFGWGKKFIKTGEDIVVTRMEHHSNFVPWQTLAKQTGANFKVVELTSGLPGGFRLDMESLKIALSGKPKILAVTMMSNVLGTVNPIKEIAELAHRAGAKVLVDAAQSVAHMPTRISDLGPIDFFAFSSHKMCGPTGAGILWGRQELLEAMDPVQFGGDMISHVGDQDTSWNELPWKLEAGTPNIAGAIGLGRAIDYLEAVGMKNIHEYENEIGRYALEQLSKISGVTIVGPSDMTDRGAVFSFEVEGIHPHDLATFLDTKGVAIRAGHHCAQPLLRKLGVQATARASFYFYNTKSEVELLVETLMEAQKYFSKGKS